MGQVLTRDLAWIRTLLVIVGAAGEPITSRPTAIPSDATSALHLSEVALCTTRVFVTLPATLELDVVVVVVMPELAVVAPVDAGAATTEGEAWRLVKVLWTQAPLIY